MLDYYYVDYFLLLDNIFSKNEINSIEYFKISYPVSAILIHLVFTYFRIFLKSNFFYWQNYLNAEYFL
jgi:hypothetical protein